MAIFGIGAYYQQDVSQDFIKSNLVGVGWGINDAPELHQFIMALKVGDIVYIKSFSPSSPDIFIKAIGIITDNDIRTDANTNGLVSCGRNVRWLHTQELRITKPLEKNNVRSNTIYEEFHPDIQKIIMQYI